MKPKLHCVAFVIALVLAFVRPHAADAAVPGTEFSYQGHLEDAGSPANGTYDFQFELFDVSTGSSLTVVSTHLGVAVTDGTFTVSDVDFGEDFDIATTDAELEIRIRESGAGSYDTLTPRQPFTAAPLAGQLRGVGVEVNSHGSLMRAYDGGSTLSAQWGTAPTGSGTYRGYAAPGGTQVLTTLLDADRDNDPSNGVAEGLLRVRGAGTGAVGGRVQLQDGSGITTIDLRGGTSGDAAAQLPDNAINAAETAEEPGGASSKTGGLVTTLNASFPSPTVLESRTITCPAHGYVLVIGTCQVIVQHLSGYRSFCVFGVSDSNGSFPPNQDVAVTIPAAEPDGNRAYPVTVHGLFEVAAGDHSFFLLGQEIEGGLVDEVWDSQLTLVYLPTAYGDVEDTGSGSGLTGVEGRSSIH